MRASTLNAPGSCRGGCSRKILMNSVAIRALVEAHLRRGVVSLCAEHPNASASNGRCSELQRRILAGGFAPASKASATSKPICWPITMSTIRHARSGTGRLAFNSSAARSQTQAGPKNSTGGPAIEDSSRRRQSLKPRLVSLP